MSGFIKTIDEAIESLGTLKKDINANNFVEAINAILRVKTFLKKLDKEQKNLNILHPDQKFSLKLIINERIPDLVTDLEKRNQPEDPRNKQEILKNLAYITDQIRGIRVTLR